MSQVVAKQDYCLEDSVHLTRLGSDAFYRSATSDVPTVIDKHQTKRLYRLQRTPYVNPRLYLDQSEVSYEKSGYFESVLRKQIDESVSQPTMTVYHRPTDMSDASMAKFAFGKSRPDPQRIVPRNMTSVRNHPAAITTLRHERGVGGEVVPLFTDRAVPDRAVRARIGPGGSLNLGEDSQQYRAYLRDRARTPPRTDRRTDELARRYMYTSVQQAALDEVAWDSKLPPKVPVPLTTYEAEGSDPLLKSTSLPSFRDVRTYDALEWDRLQPRHGYFCRKPFNNVAPLPRAQQISGYSGHIGGQNIQEMDNPTVDFKPYTVVRTEQPKFTIHSFKTDIPNYTGHAHWAKIDPVSHHDQSGHAFTTTSAFHKSLPFDTTSPRHVGLHGQLSRAVTTVLPQNPFNRIDRSIPTTNGSTDSLPHVILRSLPSKIVTPPRRKEEPVTTSE